MVLPFLPKLWSHNHLLRLGCGILGVPGQGSEPLWEAGPEDGFWVAMEQTRILVHENVHIGQWKTISMTQEESIQFQACQKHKLPINHPPGW